MSLSSRNVCGLVVLLWLLGAPFHGGADDRQSTLFPLSSYEPLRLPTTHWIRLAVDVEEYRPNLTYGENDRLVHALAVLPGIRLQLPASQFQPFFNTGLGLSLNAFPDGTALGSAPVRLQESLVAYVGGGITYHLSKDISLVGSARFAHFTSTELLDHLGVSAPRYQSDEMDFSAYTIAFGFRVDLNARPPRPSAPVYSAFPLPAAADTEP